MLQGKAWITAASFALGDKVAGQLNPPSEMIRQVLRKAIEQDLYVVAWNTAFDAAWCIAAGLEAEVFAVKWLDGMLLWRHAVVEPEGDDIPRNQRKSYALKAALAEFAPEHAGFKDFDDFQSEDEGSLKLLLHRNKMDALWTVRLAEKFWGMLTAKQQRAALIEARCIPLCAWTKVHGIVGGKSEAEELSAKLVEDAERLEEELRIAAPEAAGVNFGSPKQLQHLLYTTWGLPAERFSKKTNDPSTDKYALFDLALLDPRARLIKELREAKNNRTKYAAGTLKSLEYNGDGRVRPQVKIFSTYTSRMTYGSSDRALRIETKTNKKTGEQTQVEKTVEVPVGIALHQWKRGKEYRRLIQAPEGFTLCEFDFDGQEFRWMAVGSGDETMLSLCEPGEDAHSYMGAQIAQIDYKDLVRRVRDDDAEAGPQRKMGKFANLSFQYRVSARTAAVKARIDYELPVNEAFIQQILATYKQTYPGVGGLPSQRNGGYWGAQIRKCKELGYAETFAGRRVQLKGNWAGRDAWPMESTAINYPIQGCLQAGSRVQTSRGLIPIENLVGEAVDVWTGFRWAKAVGVDRGPCRLAVVELESGHVIRCDTRHLLKNDGKQWMAFDQLRIGDYIALPKQAQSNHTPTMCWDFVLGFYLGDGWVTERKRKGHTWDIRCVGFCGGVSKLETLQKIKDFLCTEGFDTYLRENKPGVWALEGHTKELIEKIKSFGVPPNKTARTKTLPEYVWRASPEQILNFWAGVCASDGSKGRHQEGNLHTPNLDLLKELQILLSSVLVASTITKTNNGWILRILRHDGGIYPKHTLLHDLGGFVPPCKMGDCESITDRRAVTGTQEVTQRVAERIYEKWVPGAEVYRYSKIRKIEVTDEEAVTYTMAVEDDLHQFVADGVIQKNTGGDQKYLALAVVRNMLSQFGGYFYFELHDGLFFIFPDNQAARAIPVFKKVLSTLPYKAAWGIDLPVQFPVSAKHGKTWGDLKEFS
jgi:hypothetical protein